MAASLRRFLLIVLGECAWGNEYLVVVVVVVVIRQEREARK